MTRRTCELIEAARAASIETRRSIWQCLIEARRLERGFPPRIRRLKPGERLCIGLGNMKYAEVWIDDTQ
jgi:hypothetical protein